MPYTPHTWVNGDSANVTKLNNLETQYTEATLSLGPDLFTTGFVLSGSVPYKDGSVANQLDIPAGTAYLLQADGTTRQRKWTLFNETTATPSTTYYLDLNPDGTWSWGTAHSAVANHLTIVSVTTDGSGNILAVTDARQINATLLPNMLGALFVPGSLVINNGFLVSGAGSLELESQQSGAANGVVFTTWTGSAAKVPFSVGGQFGSALAWVDNSGNLNGPAGGGIPTTRNGVATSVPIYTNTGTPSSPPTGSVWIKA